MMKNQGFFLILYVDELNESLGIKRLTAFLKNYEKGVVCVAFEKWLKLLSGD